MRTNFGTSFLGVYLSGPGLDEEPPKAQPRVM